MNRLDKVGFIPTCVGNTPQHWPCAKRWTVHPHMRGEYDMPVMEKEAATGSSPHAWGIPVDSTIFGQDRRFIPTCVGNTLLPSDRTSPSTVHPHMRGEYMSGMSDDAMDSGSSPHAWGIRPNLCHGHASGRFIPTCVGNTPGQEARLGHSPVHPHMRGEYLNGSLAGDD